MPPAETSAYASRNGVLVLKVRVTPNAGRNAIEGTHVASNGAISLKLRVKARPEKGRANKAAVALLSKTLGVAKSAIDVTAGHKDRNKTVAIEGEFDELARRIEALLGN